ncbi:hypothetical protein JOL62DRAFT_636351 [Phyllosticta paracitricarpa]|uniref:Uncharacterized protein n=1 Tax=Phyllosticta paracitricarpa TaxID=2016321 RepID=A0ABR1NHQ1_9PEZI
MLSPVASVLGSLSALALLTRGVLAQDDQTQTCFSYGMDFQGGRTYFQNIASNDNFTFVQEFEGCKNDSALNFLVDPSGNQIQCSSTPLQPDDADQMSTCPITKSKLISGAWSILIMSNNGKAPDAGLPIAYERDFSLTVGPQLTTTYTPTVTSTTVVPSIINSTTTSTSLVSKTLAASTVVAPSTTVQKTVTITPKEVVVTKTTALLTLTIPSMSLSVSKAVVTQTATCILPTKPSIPDPFARIWPNFPTAKSIMSAASAAATPTSAKFRFVKGRGLVHDDLPKWLEERETRLAAAHELDKRAPDPQPLTVTEQDTPKWVTVTSTSMAPPVTNIVNATVVSTTMIQPPAVVVLSGRTTLTPVTVTAPTPTTTKLSLTIAKTTQTFIQTVPVTVTTTITPAAVKTQCRQAGGILNKLF